MNKGILFKRLSLAVVFGLPFSLFAQPVDYYQQAVGKKGAELKTQLSSILQNAGTISYDGLWSLYKTSDVRPDGKLWEMYSSTAVFTLGSDQCGSYKGEEDCYNREHSVPQSWFNKTSPMVSDAWHVVPSDGYVNGRRSNYPFGEVGTTTYVSNGGFSKLGASVTPGYNGTVFEPNDMYKGDFARIYFYMATRYENKVGSWGGGGVFSGTYPHLSKWTLDMMLRWHKMDPVSQKEIDRNEAVYKSKQRNRNPYIDYPELVDLIFGDKRNEAFNPSGTNPNPDPNPNPEPEPEPTPEFKALEATNISSEGFSANWIGDKNAADYKLHVYTKSKISKEILLDCDLTNKVLPAGWIKSGGTYQGTTGLRLGTGSGTGTLTSPVINTTGSIKVTIAALRYNSDPSELMVFLGNQKVQTIDMSKANFSGSINIDNVTPGSKLVFKAENGKRVILQRITIEESTTETVAGYPLNTGNVTTYPVKNLEANADYYYTVTPIINNQEATVSSEIHVTTSLPNAIEDVYSKEDQVLSFIDGNVLILLNAPRRAVVKIFSTSGELIHQRRVFEEEEKIELSNNGIFILRICAPDLNITRKIIAY